jgi:hypothetical protein
MAENRGVFLEQREAENLQHGVEADRGLSALHKVQPTDKS